jgi:signal transduction histidine kinase
VQCEFDWDGKFWPLAKPAAAHIYKIAQEALSNGIKHGKARRLTLRLIHQPQTMLLSIWNDGLPFPATASSSSRMGLRTMHYRAHVVGATLQVAADARGGTIVNCVLPFPEAVAKAEEKRASRETKLSVVQNRGDHPIS